MTSLIRNHRDHHEFRYILLPKEQPFPDRSDLAQT